MTMFNSRRKSSLPSPSPSPASSSTSHPPSSSGGDGGGGKVATRVLVPIRRPSGITNPNGGIAATTPPRDEASRMTKPGIRSSPHAKSMAMGDDAFPIVTTAASGGDGNRSSCPRTPKRSSARSPGKDRIVSSAARGSLASKTPSMSGIVVDGGTNPGRGTPPPRELSKFASPSSSIAAVAAAPACTTTTTSTSPIRGRSGEEGEGVRVCVRIRPMSIATSDVDDDDDDAATAQPRAYALSADGNAIVRNFPTDGRGGGSTSEDETSRLCVYDRVYGENSTTLQLYEEMVADIVESVVRQGRNGTVFTYGQTSTGKTHTMHGILMAVGRDLFGMMMDDTRGGGIPSSFSPPHRKSLTTVRISCMELYNEELRDLLVCCGGGGTTTAYATTTSLPIQEDRRGNVQIPGLIERIVNDIDELMDAVRTAEGNRTVGSTAMNERSSRSHTIFGITYERREAMKAEVMHSLDGSGQGGSSSSSEEEEEDKENNRMSKSVTTSSRKVITTASSLYLVDLAGSESVRVSGATGQRQKEGGKINQSLLTLSRVLSKLGKRDGGHINYRDSKLTRILKPSLSGNARMGCICCISPDFKYLEESKSTLDFATRTMLVRTNAKSNTKVEYDDGLVKEFEREIERIKRETARSDERRLQMEKALQESEDEIVCLKANIELALGRAESMEREKTRLEVHLKKEICDLKKHNNELERTLIEYVSEKHILMKRQEDDRESYLRELKQMEVEQTLMAEKKNNEHQEKLKALSVEIEALRLGNTESVINLSNCVAELERTNQDLRGQLASAKNSNNAAQENDVASLKATIDDLTKDKLKLEQMLTNEIQKSMDRRNEAKERRRKFKGKLVGMAETLKDDLVHLSYQGE
ncbi:hypothetical protein ACHAXA_002553 [Cyclostephanos tholiformis]|uniref:Kinesin-like protein n=1 Tax=Cyclostephanos tholiformis TaxID=382380 RepID=A0ABD3R6S7_9STRA